MPTYMLEGQVAVRLTPKPVTIALQLSGPVSGRLVALLDGSPLEDAVRPRPELLILPRIDGAVTIRVEPVGATVFAQGSVANVSVSVNDPGAVDPERAVLPPVDLAGLVGQDALELVRVDDGLRVRSRVREVVRVELGALADAARVAATEIVGAQRLDERDAIDVALAVDASASFRRALASGQLRRAVALLEGIAAVIDPDRRPEATVLSSPPVPVVPGDASLAEAIAEALEGVIPETGAALASGNAAPLRRIAARDPQPGGAARSLTYVLTDAAPADRAAFDAGSGPTAAMHLVVLGRGTAWRLQRAPASSATLVDLERLGPAPHDDSEPDPLAGQSGALRELVASLLEGRPA